MSVDLIEAAIGRFLQSTNSEVLCLRGKWGVGKTFSWNRFLNEARRRQLVALKSYSYVSLFGLSTLDQLRYSIFENVVSVANIGIEPSVETLKKNADAVIKRFGRKFLFVGLPIARNYGAVLQALSFLSVSECIVCLDDLERKSKQLPIKDVLGLVAQLRDQKRCKVVLILNDDSLDEADKRDFEELSEKVIDRSLEFAPNASECVRIALGDASQVQEALRPTIVTLGISNIRIIKKIERHALELRPYLTKYDERVMHQALQSVTVLGWAFYSDEGPSLEFLRRKRRGSFLGLQRNEDLSEQEKHWNALLDSVGFYAVDEFDLAILESIDKGFVDESALIAAAGEVDQRFRAIRSEESLRAAWDIYHASFDDNEGEVVDALMLALKKEVHHVTPANLDGLVRLLKALGRNAEAAEAIKYFMERRNEDRQFYDLGAYAFGDEVADPDVRTAFEEKLSTFVDERSPVDILRRIALESSWSRKDMELLSKLTADDLFRIFKSTRGDDLSHIVNACLEFERIGNIDAELSALSSRARQVLKQIAAESSLNARRVRKFGVAPDAN